MKSVKSAVVCPAKCRQIALARSSPARGGSAKDRYFGHVAPVAPVICVRVAPMRYLSCESGENVRKRSVARWNRFLGFRRQIGGGSGGGVGRGGAQLPSSARSYVSRAHAPPLLLPPRRRHYHHRHHHIHALIASSELVGINWSHQLTRALVGPLQLPMRTWQEGVGEQREGRNAERRERYLCRHLYPVVFVNRRT